MNYAIIVFTLSIFTTFHTHTMNQPTNNQICYFSLLPLDVCNYIAHYLVFDDIESEEESIKRMRTIDQQKNTVEEKFYYDNFRMLKKKCVKGGFLTAYCPNMTHLALYGLNTLNIVTVKKNELLHQKVLAKKTYQQIALSRNAKMFAEIYNGEKIENYNHILTITDIDSKEQQIVDIPSNCKDPKLSSHMIESPSIAFNKQSTDIILYTLTHHLIIPITINKQSGIPPKKTLQYYFQQRLICKNNINSIHQQHDKK